MGPFDRFNDRAKRVLALAQDEAIRFNHAYIGPEHLILGLVREGESTAARVLGSLGIQLADLRRRIEQRVGRGESGPPPSEITLAPLTKRIIELAIEESKGLGHGHVGTEHLLLGLVRAGPSVASEILTGAGADPERVRSEVVASLVGRGPEAPTRATHAAAPARAAPPGFFHDAQGRKRDWYCEEVLSGRLEVEVLWQDERALALKHPFPTSPVHALVIPKKHVASLLAPEAVDPELLASMLRGVQAAAFALGLEREGFRLVASAAAPGVTPHMHWHLHGPGIPPGGEWQPRAGAPRVEWVSTPFGKSPGMLALDRFDQSAKRLLALAQEESVRASHNYIGTEHLLLGAAREETTGPLLAELGVLLEKGRTAVELIIGRGDAPTAPTELTLSPRTKKVLELAIDEARRLGHEKAAARHVVLGLIREGEGIASGILASLAVDLSALKTRLEKEPPPQA